METEKINSFALILCMLCWETCQYDSIPSTSIPVIWRKKKTTHKIEYPQRHTIYTTNGKRIKVKSSKLMVLPMAIAEIDCASLKKNQKNTKNHIGQK